MNNSEMMHLLDQMHSASDGVHIAENHLNDSEYENDTDILIMAQELKDKSALRLANITSDLLAEIIKRRHAMGDFQYPF
ncbi:MAG: hypothetical protein COC24_018780 [Alphaproteobacteria bacterium]|nr:hypothetical protein [Alphaproteobacteria bacterium]